MPSRSRRDLIYDLLAPPLILTTPFVSFVNYNDYGFARMEVWLVLGGLIALGLLCGVVMTLGGQWARIIVTAGLADLVRRLPVRLARQAAGVSRSGFRYRHAAAELASARAIESDYGARFRNDAGGDFGPSRSFERELVLWPSWSALGRPDDAGSGASSRRAFDFRRVHRLGRHPFDTRGRSGQGPASVLLSRQRLSRVRARLQPLRSHEECDLEYLELCIRAQ